MRRIILLLASVMLAVLLVSGIAGAQTEPTSKEDCKNGGYAKYGFKNQGQCIKAAVGEPPPPADTTAPVISTLGIEYVINFPASAQVSFTANEPATFECALRRTDQSELNWQPCTSPHRYENLTDGGYVFQLRATDAAGNVSEVHQSTILIDATAPTISIDSAPSEGSTVNTNSVSFGWTANDNTEVLIVNCYLQKADGTPINPDGAINGQCLDRTIGGVGPHDPINPATFSNLADGAYTFTLAANDRWQNTVLQRHFTVDTTP